MAKAYDSTLHSMADRDPTTFAQFIGSRIGLPVAAGAILDANLSATLQSDLLFDVSVPGQRPARLHVEWQTYSQSSLPWRLLRYNVAAAGPEACLVHTVVVLMRPSADNSELTGYYEAPDGQGRAILTFRYWVIRIWEEPLEAFLRGPAGLAPLALLTDEAAADLERALRQLAERLRQEDVPRSLANDLLCEAFVLAGMRHEPRALEEAVRSKGMFKMEDSATYLYLIGKGRAEGLQEGLSQGLSRGLQEGLSQGLSRGLQEGLSQGLSQGMSRADAKRLAEERELLLQLGEQRFGAPPPAALSAIESQRDLAILGRWLKRLMTAADWDGLLAE